MGHPLDPIGVLFDTLAEACIASEDQLPEISSRHLSIEPSGDNRKRLHHIPVPGVEPGQTYLILAFEVALIGETFFWFSSFVISFLLVPVSFLSFLSPCKPLWLAGLKAPTN